MINSREMASSAYFVLRFLFISSLIDFCVPIHHDSHQLAVYASRRASAQWFQAFQVSLTTVPVDLNMIYRLLVKGLICNHHRIALDDVNEMESLLINAISQVKTDPSIFRKMMTNTNQTPNPFQKLYRWNPRIRFILEDVASHGKWDVSAIHRADQRVSISHHLGILQQIKIDSSTHQNIQSPTDPVLRALNFTAFHADYLVRNPHSIADIEDVSMLFQAVMDLRNYFRRTYPNPDNFFPWMVQYWTILTMANLNQAIKMVDIVFEKAPDLMRTLWNQRQIHVRSGFTLCESKKVEAHPVEKMMLRMAVMEMRPYNLTKEIITEHVLVPSTKQYQRIEREIQEQKERGYQIVNAGSRYYFWMTLLKEIVFFCKKIQRIDPELVDVDYVAEMIRCTATQIVPNKVYIGSTKDELLDTTFKQLMTLFQRHHMDAWNCRSVGRGVIEASLPSRSQSAVELDMPKLNIEP